MRKIKILLTEDFEEDTQRKLNLLTQEIKKVLKRAGIPLIDGNKNQEPPLINIDYAVSEEGSPYVLLTVVVFLSSRPSHKSYKEIEEEGIRLMDKVEKILKEKGFNIERIANMIAVYLGT